MYVLDLVVNKSQGPSFISQCWIYWLGCY